MVLGSDRVEESDFDETNRSYFCRACLFEIRI